MGTKTAQESWHKTEQNLNSGEKLTKIKQEEPPGVLLGRRMGPGPGGWCGRSLSVSHGALDTSFGLDFLFHDTAVPS